MEAFGLGGSEILRRGSNQGNTLVKKTPIRAFVLEIRLMKKTRR
ncbi:MAG: hypothetical protein N5P05_002659 [Chroococcopsis gigantea SAG 12.99]|nr:hypothetical protein [Chroococcopsis gigantea SAG 12.99]